MAFVLSAYMHNGLNNMTIGSELGSNTKLANWSIGPVLHWTRRGMLGWEAYRSRALIIELPRV
jgi:hypothetical protein